MANYYEIADFEIYKYYFDKDLSIDKFVECLNYVCDDSNDDKKVCEFLIIMMKIKERNPTLFNTLTTLMNSKENNTYSVYVYLKFLLSSIEEKEKFMTYINKLQELRENFESSCNADFDIHKPLDVLLRMMFEIYEDLYFTDFIDYNDTFGKYRQLDISKYENNVIHPDYIKHSFIIIFITSIRLFLRIKTLIQIIYFISDKNQTKILNEGETSITPLDDFIRRFEYNIDTFTIFYNFSWIKKDITEDLKLLVDKIPSDKIIVKKFTTNYETSNNILFHIRYKLLTSLLVKQNFNSDSNRYNTWEEMTPFNKNNHIEMFLTAKYDYDCQEDSYNILKCSNYNRTHSILLLQSYNKYFKSKLYTSLNDIHFLKGKLADVTTCNKFNINQKEREDLYQFLCRLLGTFNYCRHFRYN
jgi:hypothetical protein